ncbi:acyl carrier protein [Streptomyces sp. MST-110588]|nr:acyl carrier protein [Streptomyces sp. MST-110588]
MADFTDHPVTPDDCPQELGLSSIQLLRLHTRLEAAFNTDLPRSALFTQPTIRTLLHLLTSHPSARTPTPPPTDPKTPEGPHHKRWGPSARRPAPERFLAVERVSMRRWQLR